MAVILKCYCRPSGERGSRNTRNRHLRSSYCCSVYPAVRNSYRALLRSSSIREPSDPPLRVISTFKFLHFKTFTCLIQLQTYKIIRAGATRASGCKRHCFPQLSRQRHLPCRSRQSGTPWCLVAGTNCARTVQQHHHCHCIYLCTRQSKHIWHRHSVNLLRLQV